MAEVGFKTFQSLANRYSNADLSVNSKSGELQASSRNPLNRLISLVREKLGLRGPRELERQAAYNMFHRAVAESPHYSDFEKAKVEAHVAAAIMSDEKPPLTTRRVRQWLNDLDAPRPGFSNPKQFHRDLATANHYAGRFGSQFLKQEVARQIEDRPALKEAGHKPDAAEMEAVSERIFGAVMKVRKEISEGGEELAKQIVAGYLDAAEYTLQRRNAAQQKRDAAQETGPTTQDQPTVAAQETPRQEVGGDGPLQDQVAAAGVTASAVPETPQQEVSGDRQAPAQATAQATEAATDQATAAATTHQATTTTPASETEATAPASRQDVGDKKSLRDQAKRLETKGHTQSHLLQAINGGQINNQQELATHANGLHAQWAVQNRADRWYKEGAQERGTPSRSTQAPTELKEKIGSAIRNHDQLLNYSEVKQLGREQVRQYLSAEQKQPQPKQSVAASNVAASKPPNTEPMTPPELLAVLSKFDLPRDVSKEVKEQINRGKIRDHASLVHLCNNGTADWIEQNRVGKWYGEALDKGLLGRRAPKRGQVPSDLVGRICNTVAEREEFFPYDNVKSFARGEIADYMKNAAAK